jgi:hypothetical protein
MQNLCTVAIPAYKESPDYIEMSSFKQAVKILGKWPFVLFCPKGLNVGAYVKILEKNRIAYRIEFLNKKLFLSANTYNSLLLRENFWDLFPSKFVLIYQLDAWVFRDKLEYWCKKDYDYIGAPNLEFGLVGNFSDCRNGGFSLRKVASQKRSLKFLEKVNNINNNKSKHGYSFSRFYNVFNPKSWDKLPNNEDVYYSLIVPLLIKDYNVGNFRDSMKFSMEVGSDILYKKNGDKLPFGCHAFEKYEPDFWQNFIPLKMRIKNSFSKCKMNLDIKIPDDKKLYIWGASVEGRMIFRYLSNKGYNVEAFIDKNTALHKCKYYNRKILPFEKLPKKKIFIIIGSSTKNREMAEYCKKNGLVNKKDFYVPF